MSLKLIFRNNKKHHELHRRIVERIELNPSAGATKSSHDFLKPIRRAVWNGDTKANSGAHGFLALLKRRKDSLAIFRFDLTARDQQIHQLHDGIPAFGRLHFRDNLISGEKFSQRHADPQWGEKLIVRVTDDKRDLVSTERQD